MNARSGQSIQTTAWSIAEAVRRLDGFGMAPAIVSISGNEVSEISGHDLAASAGRAAARLQAAGVGKGTTVALYAASSVDWIATSLGCGILGAVLAPIDGLALPVDAKEAAAALGAVVFVTDRPAEFGSAERIFDLSGLTAPGVEAVSAVPPSPERALATFRTSGTTGTPKTFQLTERNVGFNVAETAESGLVQRGDRVLMPLPMHHVFPWAIGVLVPLWVGAAVILPEGMTGPQIASGLRLGEPSIVVGVPKLYEAVLDAIRARLGRIGRGLLDATARVQEATGLPLGGLVFGAVRRRMAPHLRLLVSGGAKLDPETRRRLAGLGWDVRCGYGLSETAAIFSGELRRPRPGTEGEPLPGCEVCIEAAGPDGTGEILLRGPNVFDGYINNPTENARAFNADGFFRSGDLGRLDQNGCLVVTGRAKEVIVLGAGENLFPEDIEKRYAQAEDVAEIAVLEKGGVLVALVVPDMVRITQRGAIEPDMAIRIALSGVAKTLPSPQRLTDYRIWRHALPRTQLGKLRRFMLPELFESALSGVSLPATPLSEAEQAWLTGQPQSVVWELLAEARDDDTVGLDSNLALDLGFDSFAWMTFALRVEEATGVRLDSADIAEIATVRDLLDRVVARQATTPPAEANTELDAAIARWLAPQTFMERLMGNGTRGLISLLVHFTTRLEVRGLANLPETGPAIVCPNHTSFFDPVLLSTALPPTQHRRTYWAADAVIVFRSRVFRHFARPFRVFPGDKRVPDVTMGLAIETLRRGNMQVWFPEGWRSADGKMLPFQPGIGTIVSRSGAPVVPVQITGAFEAWPRDRRFPRFFRKIGVEFLPPIRAADLTAEASQHSQPPQPMDVASALARRFTTPMP